MTLVEIEGRQLKLSNLEKVLYPEAGFTKGQVIDYYMRIAPALLRQIQGRPLTLKRYPNGVNSLFFYEKRCPAHRPTWVTTGKVWSEGNNDYINAFGPGAVGPVAGMAAPYYDVTEDGYIAPDDALALINYLNANPPGAATFLGTDTTTQGNWQGVYGAEDLDAYGSWTDVAPYGRVWRPRVAVADWAS